MSSVLKDIRAVKLCAYEDAVLRKLGATRQEEMNNLRKYGVRTICVTTVAAERAPFRPPRVRR